MTRRRSASQGPDRITRNSYDLAGQLLKVQKAYGTALQQDYVTYSYTASGKQEYVTDANGNKARLVYDGYDRLSQWQFPSATSAGVVNTADYEQYGYDADGNRTSFRRRDGRVLSYSYDALNRMTTKVVPDGSGLAAAATRDVYYGYDNRGLQTAATFDYLGGEGITFGYDALGRKTTETSTMGGVSRTLTSGYDISGARTRLTYPDGQYVDYNRDTLERVYYADLNGTTPLFYPPYDTQGRLSVLYRWRYGNWNIPTSYDYDAISRLGTLTHGFATTGYNTTNTLSYNPASQLTSVAKSNDAYAWSGYVAINRAYAKNGLNQYTSAGGASFSYDANGNLTSDGTNTYQYDVENRLVANTVTGASVSYDPLGRMWQSYGSAQGYTRYLYDGDQLVAEYDTGGTMLNRYVHSDGEDDPLVWYQGSSTASPNYLYADQQGSIVAIADAGGVTTNVNAYDEYGIPKSGNAGRFQYTGQAWLPELGMYYYKARMYSPTLGRFLQTDPIGYKDQINLYAYVGNDPINKRDPKGLSCVKNGDGAYSCQIDQVATKDDKGKTQYRDATAADHKTYAKQEAALTRATNTAAQAGERKFDVKGSPSFKVSGKEIASNLAAAKATVDPSNASQDTRTPGALMSMNPGDLRIYSGSLSQLTTQEQLTVDFLHEGIHQTPSEVSALNGSPIDNQGHQLPYGAAALQIFDLGRGF